MTGRTFTVGDRAASVHFRNNFVRTYKYSAASFVPKNLFGVCPCVQIAL